MPDSIPPLKARFYASLREQQYLVLPTDLPAAEVRPITEQEAVNQILAAVQRDELGGFIIGLQLLRKAVRDA